MRVLEADLTCVVLNIQTHAENKEENQNLPKFEGP